MGVNHAARPQRGHPHLNLPPARGKRFCAPPYASRASATPVTEAAPASLSATEHASSVEPVVHTSSSSSTSSPLTASGLAAERPLHVGPPILRLGASRLGGRVLAACRSFRDYGNTQPFANVTGQQRRLVVPAPLSRVGGGAVQAREYPLVPAWQPGSPPGARPALGLWPAGCCTSAGGRPPAPRLPSGTGQLCGLSARGEARHRRQASPRAKGWEHLRQKGGTR